MELKEGYKQTDVGVIPEDWEVERLGDFLVAPPTYGANASAVPYDTSKPIYLRITDISPEGKFLEDSKSSIDIPDASDYFLKTGDIVVARTGASVGKAYCHNSEALGPFAFAGYLIKLDFDPSLVSSSFIFNQLYSTHYKNWVLTNSQRSGQPGINAKQLQSFQFAKPSLAEQRAIAEVLSDVDAEIESLAQRHEKLVAQKQGLSEELLSGRTRLVEPKSKGFKQTDVGVIPEDWDANQFGECGSIHGGLSGKSSQDFFQDANCQFVTFVSVMNAVVINSESLSRVQVEEGERQFEVQKGDLVFNGSSETPEEVAMASVSEELGPRVFLNSFCFALRPNQAKFAPLYIAYWCRSEFGRRGFSQLAQGSTRYNVSKSLFKRAQLPIPPLEEQRAIAQVLSDVDAEIQAVAKLKAKVQAKKEGLMQTLLTGKIRLT